jgi:hypothetical protein
MAASDKMWVALKIYAADGEKGLQPIRTRTTPLSSCKVLWAEPPDRHDRQQRRCTVTTRYVYWFKATSDEPLVMVRIGAAAFDGVDRHGRINPDGSEMPGASVENKQVWRRGQRRRPPRAL